MTFFRELHNYSLCFAALHAVSSSAPLGQKRGTALPITKWIRELTGFHAPRRHACHRAECLGLSGKLCKMAFHYRSHNCSL
ncbi:hypothetical protein [Burkholderia diffusa]|uniref:hypothetical protein n=1 Tax=Burkholderia diffusa TaxID=488732 RepID=UPI0009BD54E4|nr:hypothetical protein [Burkholderia diffusa]